jgi:hypothetical protein
MQLAKALPPNGDESRSRRSDRPEILGLRRRAPWKLACPRLGAGGHRRYRLYRLVDELA